MGQAPGKGMERWVNLFQKTWSILCTTFNLRNTELFVFYPKHFPQLTKLNLYYHSRNCV